MIDRSTDFLIEYHERLFEAGKGRIDLTQVTDDLGCQHGLLISPASFDRYLARPYERCISLAQSAGIRVFHHDDGAMADMLPRLVDLGHRGAQPNSVALPGMDPARLKRRYGDRIAFHGGDRQPVRASVWHACRGRRRSALLPLSPSEQMAPATSSRPATTSRA